MMFPLPEKNYCIYALKCPVKNIVRYVGLTTIGVDRIRLHWRDSRLNKSGRLIKVKSWVKSLRKRNLKFEVEYLDYADSKEELIAKEIHWIKHFKDKGFDLLNHTEGGYLPTQKSFTEEQKRVISEKTKAAMWRPEVRAKFLEGYAKKHRPKKHKPICEADKIKMSNTYYHKKLKLSVVCETGEIYSSIKELSKILKVSNSYVSLRIKTNKPIKGKFYKAYNLPERVISPKTFKGISLIDGNGNIYRTQKEASVALNLSEKTIKRMLDNNKPSRSGIFLYKKEEV